MPDSPYLKHYKVDYVNMARTVTGTVSTNTQINTNQPGGPGGTDASPTAAGSANVSNTSIQNNSRNMFWEQPRKTSRTSCTRPTRFSPKGRAKP